MSENNRQVTYGVLGIFFFGLGLAILVAGNVPTYLVVALSFYLGSLVCLGRFPLYCLTGFCTGILLLAPDDIIGIFLCSAVLLGYTTAQMLGYKGILRQCFAMDKKEE